MSEGGVSAQRFSGPGLERRDALIADIADRAMYHMTRRSADAMREAVSAFSGPVTVGPLSLNYALDSLEERPILRCRLARSLVCERRQASASLGQQTFGFVCHMPGGQAELLVQHLGGGRRPEVVDAYRGAVRPHVPLPAH